MEACVYVQIFTIHIDIFTYIVLLCMYHGVHSRCIRTHRHVVVSFHTCEVFEPSLMRASSFRTFR